MSLEEWRPGREADGDWTPAEVLCWALLLVAVSVTAGLFVAYLTEGRGG